MADESKRTKVRRFDACRYLTTQDSIKRFEGSLRDRASNPDAIDAGVRIASKAMYVNDLVRKSGLDRDTVLEALHYLENLKHNRDQRRIVCAAYRLNYRDQTGTVRQVVVASARHVSDVAIPIIEALINPPGALEADSKYHHHDQGFIDQFGKFYTREEAWVIAEAAGQIIRRCGGDNRKLFSENLY